MTTTTIVVAAVAALALLTAVAWAARISRDQHYRAEAESTRHHARAEKRHVTRHEAFAEVSAGQARVGRAPAPRHVAGRGELRPLAGLR